MLAKSAWRSLTDTEVKELQRALVSRGAIEESERDKVETPALAKGVIAAATVWEIGCLWQDRKIFVIVGCLLIVYQILSSLVSVGKHFLT